MKPLLEGNTMRAATLLLLLLAPMAAVYTGCRKQVSRNEALVSIRNQLADVYEILAVGPPTMVVAGPKVNGPYLEDCSRWAAEEMAEVLRVEGFADLFRSQERKAVEPVRDVEVVGPGSLEELIRNAEGRGVRILVFLGVRSIDIREIGPRIVDWSREGAIEILDAKTGGGFDWSGKESSRTEAPHDPHEIPSDPVAARRPLAEKWAREVLRKPALFLGVGGLRDTDPQASRAR
jgi:hypothetical protein